MKTQEKTALSADFSARLTELTEALSEKEKEQFYYMAQGYFTGAKIDKGLSLISAPQTETAPL